MPGPKAIASRLGIALDQVPGHDPHDEICGDYQVLQQINVQYADALSTLSMMGYVDQNKNLRYLLRMKGVEQVIDAYLNPPTFEVCAFTLYHTARVL